MHHFFGGNIAALNICHQTKPYKTPTTRVLTESRETVHLDHLMTQKCACMHSDAEWGVVIAGIYLLPSPGNKIIQEAKFLQSHCYAQMCTVMMRIQVRILEYNSLYNDFKKFAPGHYCNHPWDLSTYILQAQN